MRVTRAKAVFKSGPKKGKLKPGCRYLKGDGAICKTATEMQKRAKKKGKRKRTGAASRARKGVAPRTPRMDRLNAWRKRWKTSRNCGEKKRALREIQQQFKHMAARPAKSKRGESKGAAAQRRWNRWKSEYRNKLVVTERFCTGRPARVVGPVMVDGLGGKKPHPCATARPPAWCK